MMSSAYAGGDASQSTASSEALTQPVMRTTFNTVIYPPIEVRPVDQDDNVEVDDKHFRPDGPDVSLHTHTPGIFGSGVAPAASDGPYSFVSPVLGSSAEES